jgi:hypothetical protein
MGVMVVMIEKMGVGMQMLKYTVFAEPAAVQMLMVMFVNRMVRKGPIIVGAVVAALLMM